MGSSEDLSKGGLSRNSQSALGALRSGFLSPPSTPLFSAGIPLSYSSPAPVRHEWISSESARQADSNTGRTDFSGHLVLQALTLGSSHFWISAALALPWRCPGAALNFLTGEHTTTVQAFFRYSVICVHALSVALPWRCPELLDRRLYEFRTCTFLYGMNYIHAEVHRYTILDDPELSDASAGGFGSGSLRDR